MVGQGESVWEVSLSFSTFDGRRSAPLCWAVRVSLFGDSTSGGTLRDSDHTLLPLECWEVYILT